MMRINSVSFWSQHLAHWWNLIQRDPRPFKLMASKETVGSASAVSKLQILRDIFDIHPAHFARLAFTICLPIWALSCMGECHCFTVQLSLNILWASKEARNQPTPHVHVGVLTRAPQYLDIPSAEERISEGKSARLYVRILIFPDRGGQSADFLMS